MRRWDVGHARPSPHRTRGARLLPLRRLLGEGGGVGEQLVRRRPQLHLEEEGTFLVVDLRCQRERMWSALTIQWRALLSTLWYGRIAAGCDGLPAEILMAGEQGRER